MPIFSLVPDIPESYFIDQHDLSMLVNYSRGISNGFMDSKYDTMEGPTIGWARWCTTQIRQQMLYVRQENPSEQLVKLITYNQQAYIPVKIDIVLKPQFEYTTFHYLKLIKLSKACLAPEDWDFMKEYFVINSHPAHPETTLYCGFVCPETTQPIRDWSLKLILAARVRRRRSRATKVRRYKYPKASQLNFEAENIMELFLDWEKTRFIIDPVALRHISDEDLIAFARGEKELEFLHLLSHNQPCEKLYIISKNSKLQVEKNV